MPTSRSRRETLTRSTYRRRRKTRENFRTGESSNVSLPEEMRTDSPCELSSSDRFMALVNPDNDEFDPDSR